MPNKKSIVLHLLTTHSFPSHIQSTFIHNASKIYAKIVKEESIDNLKIFAEQMINKLNVFLISENLEVQERSTNLLQIINITTNEALEKSKDKSLFESIFYAYNLNPVASIAQRKVPIPQGLNLDEPFRSDTDEEEEEKKEESVDKMQKMLFMKE